MGASNQTGFPLSAILGVTLSAKTDGPDGFNVGAVSTTEKAISFFTNTSGLKWNESLGWVTAGLGSYPVQYQGFNILSTGREDASKTAIWVQTEHDYGDPSEGYLSEWHLNYQNASGAGSRSVFVKFHRDAGGGFAAGEAAVELRGEITLCSATGVARMQIPNDSSSPIRLLLAGMKLEVNNTPALTQKRTDADYETLLLLGSDNRVKIAPAFAGGLDIGGTVAAQSGISDVRGVGLVFKDATNGVGIIGTHTNGSTTYKGWRVDASNRPIQGDDSQTSYYAGVSYFGTNNDGYSSFRVQTPTSGGVPSAMFRSPLADPAWNTWGWETAAGTRVGTINAYGGMSIKADLGNGTLPQFQLDTTSATAQLTVQLQRAGTNRWALLIPSGAAHDFWIYNSDTANAPLKFSASDVGTYTGSQFVIGSVSGQVNFTISRAGTPQFDIYSAGTNDVRFYERGSGTDIVRFGSGTMGVYGVSPVARQLMATGTGKTVDEVITALQAFGIFRQS